MLQTRHMPWSIFSFFTTFFLNLAWFCSDRPLRAPLISLSDIRLSLALFISTLSGLLPPPFLWSVIFSIFFTAIALSHFSNVLVNWAISWSIALIFWMYSWFSRLLQYRNKFCLESLAEFKVKLHEKDNALKTYEQKLEKYQNISKSKKIDYENLISEVTTAEFPQLINLQ